MPPDAPQLLVEQRRKSNESTDSLLSEEKIEVETVQLPQMVVKSSADLFPPK